MNEETRIWRWRWRLMYLCAFLLCVCLCGGFFAVGYRTLERIHNSLSLIDQIAAVDAPPGVDPRTWLHFQVGVQRTLQEAIPEGPRGDEIHRSFYHELGKRLEESPPGFELFGWIYRYIEGASEEGRAFVSKNVYSFYLDPLPAGSDVFPPTVELMDMLVSPDPIDRRWGARGLGHSQPTDPEALAALERIGTGDPDGGARIAAWWALGRLWINRGVARIKKGDLDGAIADLTSAIEVDHDNAWLWGVRGSARGNKGDYDGAIDDFNRAIKIDPNLAAAWRTRGLTRHIKGDLDGAIGDLGRFLELAPKDPQAGDVRAEIQKIRAQQAKAGAGDGM